MTNNFIEILVIEQMIKDFEQTQNPTLISKIITQFHNNRFGNQSSHPLIINNYFSKSIMNKYLERVDNAILKIDDELEEEEYLSNGDFSEVSHSDIGTCYEVLDFFLTKGKTLENEEEVFYIEREN